MGPYCEFKSADLVLSNLECCFYEPDAAHALDREGFFPPLASAEALKIAGIHGVGIANSVNYGTAPILSSIARLDQLGIPHTGAGKGCHATRFDMKVVVTGSSGQLGQYVVRSLTAAGHDVIGVDRVADSSIPTPRETI